MAAIIRWITTPTCKECGHWDPEKKQCTLKRCAYPNKR